MVGICESENLESVLSFYNVGPGPGLQAAEPPHQPELFLLGFSSQFEYGYRLV